MNSVIISVTEKSAAPTTASSCDRSASGEMRSFSRNRLRKWRVSVEWMLLAAMGRLGAERRDRGELTRDAGGVLLDDQLREHALQ